MTMQTIYKTAFVLSVVVIVAAMLAGCKHVVTYKPNDSGAHWHTEPVYIND